MHIRTIDYPVFIDYPASADGAWFWKLDLAGSAEAGWRQLRITMANMEGSFDSDNFRVDFAGSGQTFHQFEGPNQTKNLSYATPIAEGFSNVLQISGGGEARFGNFSFDIEIETPSGSGIFESLSLDNATYVETKAGADFLDLGDAPPVSDCFWTDLLRASQECGASDGGDGWVDLLTAGEIRNFWTDEIIELPYTSSDPDIVRVIYTLPPGATITRWRAQCSFSTTDAALTGKVGLSIPENEIVYSEDIASPGTTPLVVVDTALSAPISQSLYTQVEVGFQQYTADGPLFTNCVYDITQLDVYIEYGA